MQTTNNDPNQINQIVWLVTTLATAAGNVISAAFYLFASIGLGEWVQIVSVSVMLLSFAIQYKRSKREEALITLELKVKEAELAELKARSEK